MSSEIRKIVAEFRSAVDIDVNLHLSNLNARDNHKIYGAYITLQNIDPEIIFSDLSNRFDMNNDIIIGLMCCLNYMKCTASVYTVLIFRIYVNYKNIKDENCVENISWGLLRECRNHFKNIKRNDLLMSCLLDVEHLGSICSIERNY